MEPAKSNPIFTVCPIGKACSSLTSGDIIKLLTGGFRLSKARCNDIFWEAVWPRLLARGWHSEQPNNQDDMGSNHHLVFLIPGVKKFSKRKLVKGNHYFDSVSDVLSKVASEPKLIELESEEDRGSSCNEEEKAVLGAPSDHSDASIKQSFHYLKPRASNNYNLKLVRFTVVDCGLVDGGKLSKTREMRYAPEDLKVKSLRTTLSSRIKMIFLENSLNDNELDAVDMSLDDEKTINNAKCYGKTFDGHGSNHTKFTIVDTSLIHEGKSTKVREVRYSPVDITVTSKMTKSSRRKGRCSSEDSLDRQVPDAAKMLSHEDKNIGKSNHNKDIVDSSGSKQKVLNHDKLFEDHQGNNNVSDENQSTGTIKHRFSRRSKSGYSNNLDPVVKRRRLVACSSAELSQVIDNFSVSPGSKQEESYFALKLQGGSNNVHVNPPQKLPFNISLAEGSLQESTASLPSVTCFDIETSHGENGKHQTPSLIDLNLPQVSLDCENDGPALMDAESRRRASAGSKCLSNSDKTDLRAWNATIDASSAPVQPSLTPEDKAQDTDL